MNVDDFLEAASASDLRLPALKESTDLRRAPETLDALFYMPLLALTIMVIARRTPFKTMALGRSVALLLIEHFVALKRSAHRLETSLTLRRRCADALAFLESSGLVTVSGDQARVIMLTEAGKRHTDICMRDTSDLGLFVRSLRTAQERVKARFGTNER